MQAYNRQFCREDPVYFPLYVKGHSFYTECRRWVLVPLAFFPNTCRCSGFRSITHLISAVPCSNVTRGPVILAEGVGDFLQTLQMNARVVHLTE